MCVWWWWGGGGGGLRTGEREKKDCKVTPKHARMLQPKGISRDVFKSLPGNKEHPHAVMGTSLALGNRMVSITCRTRNEKERRERERERERETETETEREREREREKERERKRKRERARERESEKESR